jgi:hypothetical protein
VKEFAPPKSFQKPDWHDPYKRIRKKIKVAAGQFKGCKDSSCSLVLSNLNCPIVRLGNPEVVMAAMLGNLAFQVPVGIPLDVGNPGKTVFTVGGSMVGRKNTRFSSIIVLGTYALYENKIEAAANQRRLALGRKMTIEEAVEGSVRLIGEMKNNGDAPRVRVVVYENASARIPLSRELFQGPFDERWIVGGERGYARRLFMGEEIVREKASLDQSTN